MGDLVHDTTEEYAPNQVRANNRKWYILPISQEGGSEAGDTPIDPPPF